MEQEIVFKTRVDTGNTVKDVNAVTDSIKKAELEVDKLSSKFGENSKEADDARKALAKLNIEAGDLAKETTNLSGRFEDFYGDLQPMTGRIGELEDRLYELALAGQQNTQEFKDLQAETVRLKKVIVDVDMAVDNLSQRGKNLQTALSVGSVVTAGYGAIQGAMALAGNESENLTKTLVKLQAVQSVLAGIEEIRNNLQADSLIVIKAKLIWDKIKIASEYAYATAVGTSTGAIKLMRIAMLALPIVAIIAGLVAIASAMGLFGDATASAEEKQEALNKSIEKNTKRIDENIAKQKEINQIRSGGIADTENEIRLLESQEGKEELIFKRKKDLINQRLDALIYIRTTQRKLNAQELEEEKKLYTDLQILTNEEIKFRVDKDNQLKEEEKKSREERKKARESERLERERIAKEQAQKQLELERLITDLSILNIEDAEVRRLEQLRISHERERIDLIEKYGNNTELEKQLKAKQQNELNALIETIKKEQEDADKEAQQKLLAQQNANEKAGLEAKLLAVQNNFNQEIELKKQLALVERDQALQDTELTEGEKAKIKEEYELKIRELNKETSDKELENQRIVREQTFQIANDSLASIQNLSDIVFTIKAKNLEKGSKAELENAKKQFEINKQLQIATALINGAQAVTAILAVPDFTLGVASAIRIASAGLATVATVAKISATKFGGSGGGGSVTAPSVPSNSGSSNTQSNNSGTGALGGNETNTLNATNNATGIKVSVVDSEIKAIMDASAQVNVISTMGG